MSQSKNFRTDFGFRLWKTESVIVIYVMFPSLIDRSFDKIQEKYIERFNSNGQVVDKAFVREYLDDLSLKIAEDSGNKKYQYKNMHSQDISSQLSMIDDLRNNEQILEKIVNDEAFILE